MVEEVLLFEERTELLSMECKVEINSTYICRNCLSALRKRRALLTNLHKVNIARFKRVMKKTKTPKKEDRRPLNTKTMFQMFRK